MEGVECRLLEYRPMAPRTAPHDRMVLGWRNPIESHLAKRRGLWSSAQSNTNRKMLLARVTRQSDPPERTRQSLTRGSRPRDPPAPAGPPPRGVCT